MRTHSSVFTMHMPSPFARHTQRQTDIYLFLAQARQRNMECATEFACFSTKKSGVGFLRSSCRFHRHVQTSERWKKASPTELRWKQLAKCNAEWQQQQTTEIEEKRTTNTTKIGYIRWKEIILSLCMSSLTLIENSSTHSARIHPVHSRVASTLYVYRQNNGKNTAENEMKKRFCSRKKAPLKTKWLKLLEFNCSCSSAFAQTSGMR